MKKQKFLTLFSILALCICTLFVGVWAAKTATVTTGGSITFTATNVYAEVTGSIAGAGKITHGGSSITTTKTLKTLSFNSNTEDGGTNKTDWVNNAMEFNEAGDNITITVNVKNLAKDRTLYARITSSIESNDVSINITGGTGYVLTIAGGGTNQGTYTITFSLNNKDVSVSAIEFGFEILLSSDELEPIIPSGVPYQKDGNWYVDLGVFPQTKVNAEYYTIEEPEWTDGFVPVGVEPENFTYLNEKFTIDASGTSYGVYQDTATGKKYMKTGYGESYYLIEPIVWQINGYYQTTNGVRGSYVSNTAQGFDPSNKTDIQLDIVSNAVLLAMQFGTTGNWQDSYIRTWIKTYFINEAFTNAEKTQIQKTFGNDAGARTGDETAYNGWAATTSDNIWIVNYNVGNFYYIPTTEYYLDNSYNSFDGGVWAWTRYGGIGDSAYAGYAGPNYVYYSYDMGWAPGECTEYKAIRPAMFLQL